MTLLRQTGNRDRSRIPSGISGAGALPRASRGAEWGTGRRIMRFGFFDQLPCADGFSERQRLRDLVTQIELGEELGLDTVWLGELHFSRAFSVLASPLMVLAAAAQRTTRIRLGTAVTLLPLHNPVKIAEEAATVDILSGGRLELGVGRGAAPSMFAAYNVPAEETRERSEERR